MNTNDLQDASFQTQQDNSQDQESSTFTNRARALKDTAQQWQRQATDATRKAAKATDLMTDSPAPVEAKQLRDLHIELKVKQPAPALTAV